VTGSSNVQDHDIFGHLDVSVGNDEAFADFEDTQPIGIELRVAQPRHYFPGVERPLVTEGIAVELGDRLRVLFSEGS
jgi:hypothetical protein